jgi:hypothetical protein
MYGAILGIFILAAAVATAAGISPAFVLSIALMAAEI